MKDDDRILRDIFNYCLYGSINWSVYDTKIITLLSSKIYITKNKYYKLNLCIHKDNEIPLLNDISLDIMLSINNQHNMIKSYISKHNPILIDIYDIIDIENLD